MSRRTVTFILIFMFTAVSVHCQDRSGGGHKRSALNLSVCGYPIGDRIDMGGSWGLFKDYSYREPSLEGIYSPYTSEAVSCGLWRITYCFNEDRAFSVIPGISADLVLQDKFDYDGTFLGKANDKMLGTFARIRYYIVNKEGFRCYTAADIGMKFGWIDGDFDTYWCLQHVPFGMSFGKKFFVNIEVGGGTEYIGGAIGVGYIF